MFKKLFPFAAAALLIAAFTTPAVAQAEEAFWYSDPGHVELGGEEEAEAVSGVGVLSFTSGGLVSGPSEVQLNNGIVWNGTAGEGEFEASFPNKSTPTSLSFLGCNVQETTVTETKSKLRVKLAWPYILDVSWEYVHLHYNTTCQKLGIPATVTITGTATGEFNNETGCVEFVNAGDMKVASGGEPAVTTNGEICLDLPLTVE